MTYIATEEGWLFLAVVIDPLSRKMVVCSMGPDMGRDLVLDALEMAWLGRNPGKQTGLINFTRGLRQNHRRIGKPSVLGRAG